MCGIAGKVDFAGRIVPGQIKKMTGSIAHRGPDDEGVFVSDDGRVGLGSRRLSILDLSKAGHMPMHYMNRYLIIQNGEIYNFKSERAKLRQSGYTFRSNGDTEVIAALYDKYKENCVKHLRGMFAFVIYDKQEEVLFLARDRVGQKPLKYFWDGKKFIFASELKAILTQAGVKKEVDFLAVHHYLTLQYVPSPQTGFKNIFKLEPGHYLRLDLKKKILTKQKYWDLDYSEKLDLSEKQWKEKILHTLEEAVRLRMISDVPLGAFLSGGIDSSAVVALMSKLSKKPIRTFSIGFDNPKYDETKYARIIAEKYKTQHTEFRVEPDSIEILPYLVEQYEEPYADSSALPTYYLSKLTREHVTVALNGDGGDENFAGYGRYSVQKFSLYYDYLKILNKHIALPMAKSLADTMKSTFFDRAYRFSKTMSDDYRHRYVNYLCYFSNEDKEGLYSSGMKQLIDQDSYQLIVNKFDEAHTDNKMDQVLYADIMTYLPDDLLVKVDIATMANSLEGRSPFLDHKFMELTAKMPFDLKLSGLNEKKYILKKALEDLVPDEVMYRPKKGFGVPIESWFRGELSKYTEDKLLSKKSLSRGLFKKDYVKGLLSNHRRTKINLAPKIWALLTLELWFEKFID